MFAYPQTLPQEEILMIVARLRGDTSKDASTLLQAGWTVLGYGLNYLPHGVPMVSGSPQVSDAEAATQLENLAKSSPTAKGVAIPWNILLPVLINLLQNLATRM